MNDLRSRLLTTVTIALVLGVGFTPADAQQITGMSASTLARSGRLLIFGDGFGAEQGAGRVFVDSLEAIVTTWSETEIHAYVPEAAALGQTTVIVETGLGVSNPATLEVTLRQAEGRFRWQFEMDDRAVGPWSAVGPDGTVYCSDIHRLYAVAADGALRWVFAGAGAQRPITFGAAGTIYAAAEEVPGEPQGVVAINPDGTLRWQFAFDTGFDLMVGPGVGPDGNIYAVSNTNLGGPGTFALDADGNLLWTNPGPGASGTINLHEIDFALDRFYITYNGQVGAPSIIAYDYSGNVLWDSDDLGQTMGSPPELDPDGRLILQWALIGTQAWTPDADVEWIYDADFGNVVPPAVGPDGMIYAGTWLGGDLYALHPDGTPRWIVEDGVDGFLWNLGVAPDNSVIVDGGARSFGQPSTVRGFDTGDGTQLWRQDFHVIDGLNEFAAWAKPVFSADSQTAYVTTQFSSDVQPGYLYAVDITGGSCIQSCLRSVQIDLRGRFQRDDARVDARVLVEDEAGAPVVGVQVDVTWTLPDGTTLAQTALTNGAGAARFRARDTHGDYRLTVDDLVKDGYTFDPDNSVRTKSLFIP